MDLKETTGRETKPGPPPRGIPNLGRRIFASAFWTIIFGGTGFLLFNYTKDIGTEKNRERMKIEKLQGILEDLLTFLAKHQQQIVAFLDGFLPLLDHLFACNRKYK